MKQLEHVNGLLMKKCTYILDCTGNTSHKSFVWLRIYKTGHMADPGDHMEYSCTHE